MHSSEKVFVTGYARLPQGITANEFYSVVGVGLIIDKHSGMILDADISLVTRTGKAFFKETVTGHNIDDIHMIIKQIEKNYLGHAKKAIISALKSAHQKYNCYKDNGYTDISECYNE